MSDESHIWEKVQKTETCWLWTGGTSGGYPSIRWNKKGESVARLVYELVHKIDAGKKFVRQTCGNKLCVRPDHLYLKYTTLDPITGEDRIERDRKRFSKYVSEPDERGCMLWKGHTNGQYGMFHTQGKGHPAHRFAYMMKHGPIIEGMVVRHKCDVRLCVNVDHLEIGTHKDNCRDMYERGRAPSQQPGYKPWQAKHPDLTIKGGKHHRAKLTDDQAKAVRILHEQGLTQIAIGKMFGVSNSTVSLIVRDSRYNIPKAKPSGT